MNPQPTREAQAVIDWNAPVEKPVKVELDEVVYRYKYTYNMVFCSDCVYGANGNRTCKMNPDSVRGCCLSHGEVKPEIIEAVEKYWNTRNGG